MPTCCDDQRPIIPEGYSELDFNKFEITLIAMRTIEPMRRRQASYIARFNRMWRKDYFQEINCSNWVEYTLSDELNVWLEENATNYDVTFDRGDWGEGSPIAEVDFATREECKAFIDRFQHIIHAISLNDHGQNTKLNRIKQGLE